MLRRLIKQATSDSPVGRVRDQLIGPPSSEVQRLYREATREPLTKPASTKLPDGTYDPFAVEDERAAGADQQLVRTAQTDLIAALCALPFGSFRDPWAGQLAGVFTGYHANRAQNTISNLARELRLNERVPARQVVRDTDTGMLHVLPKPLLADGALPGWRKTKLACELKVAKDRLERADVGEWRSVFCEQCPSCAPHAELIDECELAHVDVDLDAAHERAMTLTCGWMHDMLLRVQETRNSSFLRRLTGDSRNGEWGIPTWSDISDLAYMYAQAGAVVGLFEQLHVAGDDALRVLLGDELRVLRSRLTRDQHRLVDLLDDADYRQLAAAYHDAENSFHLHERNKASLMLAGILRHKTGLHPNLGLHNGELNAQITGKGTLWEGTPEPRWDRLAEIRAGWR